jgi:Complex 1 protein (LYR family)
MPPKLWLPNNATTTTTIVNKHLSKTIRNTEAISLYRDIVRTAKHFHWKDEKTGQPWNILLKEQARKEFLESKQETDPLIIARLLITGRDCLQQIHIKFNNATNAAWKRIETDNTNTKR